MSKAQIFGSIEMIWIFFRIHLKLLILSMLIKAKEII